MTKYIYKNDQHECVIFGCECVVDLEVTGYLQYDRAVGDMPPEEHWNECSVTVNSVTDLETEVTMDFPIVCRAAEKYLNAKELIQEYGEEA